MTIGITLKYGGYTLYTHNPYTILYTHNPCAEMVPWIPEPWEITPKVEAGPRAPRPRYGWRGLESYCQFPIGTRVWIGGASFGMMAEVIELGTPPSTISHMTDLVHLRIIEPGKGGHSVGYEDWWVEDSLTEVQ